MDSLSNEAPPPPNGEGDSPVVVVDLTHLVETPPAPPPAQNPAPGALIEVANIDTPSKRRAEEPMFGGLPEKRQCLSPPKSDNGEAIKCPVCFDCVRQREPVSTICGHVFCKECIQAAIRAYRKCPICKKRLTLRNFHRIFL